MPHLIEVCSAVPASLSRLSELASNLFFSWHRPTRALFEDLDPELWEQVNGNPRLMLRCVEQGHLDHASTDDGYLARYREVVAAFDHYVAIGKSRLHQQDTPLVAYLCAEYGFHESFPIYSGGLGILAGDYCKAASDERLNFVAVGLLYRQGYFIQSVDSDGVQHALYRNTDPRDLPVEGLRNAAGGWLTVSVEIADRKVIARIWRAQVGRVTIYLLDSNCPENSEADRDITHRLYGGDTAARIQQEMMLGIGGVRALRALGLQPAVWHINEGHAAFSILERMREGMKAGLELQAALELAAASCVFTTHTPVAAGHDAFNDALFRHCFSGFAASAGIDPGQLLELGRAHGAYHEFNMTRLALNGARHINGVSRIHGGVSAQLCADHWPEVPANANPVGYVTNGVHVPTFLAQPWASFFDSHIGANWRESLNDHEFWQALDAVPNEVFWEVAQDIKSRMLTGVRDRLTREYARKGLSTAQLGRVTRLLDPDNPNVLTLGFARRFATYKRASLLLRDRDRLARLIGSSERPLLFIFAGKAHPADHPGQHILREIKQLMLTPKFAGHVLFLEDYDMQLARWLVGGVDVWLNNPITPLEASGTSGMKAAINGRLNLSVLDGWWSEAYDGSNGWGIPGAQVQDNERRDSLDTDAILDTLEREVMPLYYERDAQGLPPDWVRACKRAMMTVIPQFNSRRMVRDYQAGMYAPAARGGAALAANECSGARELAQWKRRVRAAWPGVSLAHASELSPVLSRTEQLQLRVAVQLNGLGSDDVALEFVARRRLPHDASEPPALCSYGAVEESGTWQAPLVATRVTRADGATFYEYAGVPPSSGQYAMEVRLRPANRLLSHPMEMGLLKTL
jgi:starch phosphorylase